MTTQSATTVYGVRSLFQRKHSAATLLLGAGVGMEALEFYITSSLMPSMVRDIGGLHLLAWTTSLFVVALVLGGVAIVIRPQHVTLRQVYGFGAVIFAIGCLIVGLAPSMPIVLVGRFVQGFGAGLLVTLAYSFIRFVYPEGMQNAASAFYSALWGISTLLGPTVGGIFAHGSSWRWAFIILIPLALIMALAAGRFLPEGRDEEREKQAVPALQIFLIVGSTLAISYAGSVTTTVIRVILLAAGILALVGIIVAERMSKSRLLPEQATRITPLARVFLALFLLIVVLNSDIFVPYLLQTLHGTSPLFAGYIVALVASGWAVAGMTTASWSERKAMRAIIVGPCLLFVSTFSLAWIISTPNPEADLLIIGMISALLFLMGAGIGIGWAHLVSLVMTLSRGPDADKATAAINLVPSLAAAFGSALVGVIANSTGLVEPGGVEGAVSAAFWLYSLISISALLAAVIVLPLYRRQS